MSQKEITPAITLTHKEKSDALAAITLTRKEKKGNQIRCKRFSRWVYAYETCEEYIDQFMADFAKEIEREYSK